MRTTSPIMRPPGLTAAALLCGLVAASAGAGTTLRWKFQEGQILRYTMVQTQSMISKADGQEFKQGFTLMIDQVWAVKAVDPSGVASMTQTIDRVRTTADLPSGKVTFDSREAKDATSLAGPLFKMLVGAELSFRMNPRGEISDIKLPEKMVATLRGDREPAGAQGQFSEVGLKNMLAQMGILLPEGPVDVGQSWGRKMAIPAGPDGQTRSIDQTYTYKGTDASPGGKAQAIDVVITFEAPKPDPNVPVTIKAQESRGRISFDNAAGRVESSRVTEHVELTGKIMDKEITQAGETTTTMTLSDDKPR